MNQDALHFLLCPKREEEQEQEAEVDDKEEAEGDL